MTDNFDNISCGDFSYSDDGMYYPTYEDFNNLIYGHVGPWSSSWDGLEASGDDWIETWEFIQKL